MESGVLDAVGASPITLKMRKGHDNEGWETNRYKKLRITQKAWFYCICDREVISVGAKCPLCKRLGGKRKLKKY